MGAEITVWIPERARKILRKSFAQVATYTPDGSTHVSPIQVSVEGEDIVVETTELRMKASNLQHDREVAIVAIDPDDPADAVIVRGRVAEAIYEGAGEQAQTLGKRFDPEFPSRALGERRVRLRVEPHQVSTARE
jgi:PPOX class probable F420-dependent enzyme